MRVEGGMKDHSQLRMRSGNKAPGSCNVKENIDNFIDVDSDGFDNVISLDGPKSLKQKLKESTVFRQRKKFPSRVVICIDDDETTNVGPPRTNVEGGVGDLDSDASSSKSHLASNFIWKSLNADDECEVIWERKSAFKLSKCKQTHSRKAPSRNRYGLSFKSESGSLESDSSDCELIEGSFGKLREQWEKASLRRKYNVPNGKSGLEDQSSASGSRSDTNQNVEAENVTQKPAAGSVCSSSSNANVDNGSSFTFTAANNVDLAGTSFSPEVENLCFGSKQKLYSESFSWLKHGSTESKWKGNVHYGGDTFSGGTHVGARFCHEGISFQGPSISGRKQQSDKQHHTKSCFMDKGQNIGGETSRSRPDVKMHSDHEKAGVLDEDSSVCKSKNSGDSYADYERVDLMDKNDEFSPPATTCSFHPKGSPYRTAFKESEERVSGEPLASGPQFSDETQDKSSISASVDKVKVASEESFFSKISLCPVSGINNKKVSDTGTIKPDFDKMSLPNIHYKQGTSCIAESEKLLTDKTCSSQQNNVRDPLCVKGSDISPFVGKNIINDREKLKETDEYKRAIEEEWASRHRQLQIQAEEAQRLRKRKKAESMRRLDMTIRQKQRVEEMRETQKKDEENMNMKEQLRAEVLMELNKLESTCIDMASLLRGLGIDVGGGFHPLSNEVRAAYKKALLRFHPDRASRTDIRQQVEAEEKFKLISRMKEKFLSASCH